jgi:type I restriction enzyme R subunit
VPRDIDTPGKRALYNNLRKDAELVIQLDRALHHARPDGWRGVPTRENAVKRALYGVLQDEAEVERIFPVIVSQREY